MPKRSPNFAEATFPTQQSTEANVVVLRSEKDMDNIYQRSFEAAAFPTDNLDVLCSQLTHRQ